MSTAPATDHEAIRPEPPKTYYDGVIDLPGFNKAPQRCRPYSPVGFCEGGHTILGRSSCGVRYCPDHWRDWTENATIAIVARLAAYRHVKEGAEKRVSHVVASPPQDRRYSVDRLWATRSEAYEALEAAGCRGGVTVTHAHRTNDRGNALYETAVEHGAIEEDYGRWRFLRETADDMDDLGRYVEAAPHYHVMAPGEDIDGEAVPDGWIVKRIRSFGQFHYWDTESYRDMARSVYYVLTHGAVQQGRAMTTYFGEVHPSTFNPEEELTAAVWRRIQMEAEKAVKEHPDDDGSGGIGGGSIIECPNEDCEEAAIDIQHIREYLDDDDWVSSLLVKRDGRKRWLRLRGLLIWYEEGGDRPPPSVRTKERRMLEWLEAQGATIAPEPVQSGLCAY